MVFPGPSRPSRSASVTIRSTGRSLTDPPGLNHSALTWTSTARGRLRVRRERRMSGVRPIRSIRDASGPGPWAAGGRLLVEEIGRLCVVPNPMRLPARLSHRIETALLGRDGLRALEPLEGNVEAQDPAGDEVAGEAGGRPPATRNEAQDVRLVERRKDHQGPLPMFRPQRLEILAVDSMDRVRARVEADESGEQPPPCGEGGAPPDDRRTLPIDDRRTPFAPREPVLRVGGPAHGNDLEAEAAS